MSDSEESLEAEPPDVQPDDAPEPPEPDPDAESEPDDADDGAPTPDKEVPEADALECIAEAQALQKTLDILQTVSHESIMHLGNHGWQTRLADPATVYNAEVRLTPDAFESVGEGSWPIGVEHERLEQALSKANKGDLVHLKFDLETRKMVVEYKQFSRKITAIDPDTIQNEPPDPDLPNPNQFETEGKLIADAIDVAKQVSDHVSVKADMENESIVFSAQGDMDSTTTTLSGDDLGFVDIDNDGECLLSCDYMSDVVKEIPDDATVTAKYGEDDPLVLEWAYQDGWGEVKQLIAPRIPSHRQ